jgi:hypothetical protein
MYPSSIGTHRGAAITEIGLPDSVAGVVYISAFPRNQRGFNIDAPIRSLRDSPIPLRLSRPLFALNCVRPGDPGRDPLE